MQTDKRFDARFSATRRHYLFRILARRSPPALDINRVWWLPVPLDAEAMHAGAQMLIGKHDFTTFRAASCQANSALRTLDRLDVSVAGEEIHINASARSFLHNQVRSMVGSLKLVGTGRWQPRQMGEALTAKNCAACGPVSPPSGLYLARVDYGATNSPERESFGRRRGIGRRARIKVTTAAAGGVRGRCRCCLTLAVPHAMGGEDRTSANGVLGRHVLVPGSCLGDGGSTSDKRQGKGSNFHELGHDQLQDFEFVDVVACSKASGMMFHVS